MNIKKNNPDSVEIEIFGVGKEFFYVNDEGKEECFTAYGIEAECSNLNEDILNDLAVEFDKLVIVFKGESDIPFLVTDLPNISDSNPFGYLFDKPFNEKPLKSFQEAVDFMKNLKAISFYQIRPKDGQHITDIDHRRTYHDNNNLWEEYEVDKNGIKDGYYKLFHDNGQLQVELSFSEGEQNPGAIISYHKNGNKAREVILSKNGKFNGAFTEWHDNGKLKKQGVYNENTPTVKKEWDENGENLISNIKESNKKAFDKAPDLKEKHIMNNYKFNDETLREAVEEWIEDKELTTTKYGHISNWNVENVTDMSGLFEDAHEFNEDISKWNISNVRNLQNMFKIEIDEDESDPEYISGGKFNCNISKWNTLNVVDMKGMFMNQFEFNQDIGNWDVSRVNNMTSMFQGAKEFNQDIGNWDVCNVSDMESMFEDAESFDKSLNKWDTSNVTNMRRMFYCFGEFDGVEEYEDDEYFYQDKIGGGFNGLISNWNVSKVETMELFLCGQTKFDQDIGGWNVSNVCNMDSMFENCKVFNQDIGGWNVSKVKTMSSMFKNAECFDQPIQNWDVSNVFNMGSMFEDCKVFNQPIGKWDTSNVIDMKAMFCNAKSFNQQLDNLSNLHANCETDYIFFGAHKEMMNQYEVDEENLYKIKKNEDYLNSSNPAEKGKESLNKLNDNETMSMIVTFANTIFSEHPNISFLIEKCENSFSDFENIYNNCIKGEFEIPAELKNHIEVLKYDIDVTQAFSNGNNYLTMDIDCIVTFTIKTTKDEAIDKIEKYQEDNDDLRWNLSIEWVDTDNKEKYWFDSWDEDILEEIIEDEPCWYDQEDY